jgi:hypothetical protein
VEETIGLRGNVQSEGSRGRAGEIELERGFCPK